MLLEMLEHFSGALKFMGTKKETTSQKTMKIIFTLAIFVNVALADGSNPKSKGFLNKNADAEKVLGYKVYYDSVAVKIKNFENLNVKTSRIGDFYYEFEQNNLSNPDQQLFVLVGPDNKIKFSNGSIIINFITLPDLHKFAKENDLVFLKEFPVLNSAVFQVKDFTQLNNVILNLKSRPLVLNLSLDLIDPNLRPK